MGKRLILRRLYLKIHTKHATELTRFCEMFYRQLHINWKSGKSSRASNQYVPRHFNELYKLYSAEKHVCFCLQFFFGQMSWTLDRFFLEHWPWVSSCSQATTRCRCQAALSTVWPLLARSWT